MQEHRFEILFNLKTWSIIKVSVHLTILVMVAGMLNTFFLKLSLLNNNFKGVVGVPTVQKYLMAQTDVVKNMINATTAYRVVFSVVHRRSSPMIGKDYPEVESNVQIELIHVIGKRVTVIERLSNVTFRIDPPTMPPISMAHIKATRRQHANNIDYYFKRLS